MLSTSVTAAAAGFISHHPLASVSGSRADDVQAHVANDTLVDEDTELSRILVIAAAAGFVIHRPFARVTLDPGESPWIPTTSLLGSF